jgi:CRISPR system Cascade subunit CasE
VVYSLFDDIRTETEKHTSVPSGIQWADKGGNHLARQLLILSDREPKPCAHAQLESKAVPDGFLEHQRYRFVVTICPVKRHSSSRKLVPVKGRQAIADWFCQRGPASWGFAVEQEHLQVESVTVQQFKGKQGAPITLQQATLNGVLSVMDKSTFQKSFHQGIGRSRSFGCGLLQIVPAIDNLFA